MRPAPRVLWSAALFVLLAGLEWEGLRARWLRDVASGDEQARIDAVRGLASLGGSEVDAAIATALVDGSHDVRLEAAFACETRALGACAGPLGEWLDAADPEVRAVAARALGHVGTDADAPRLARVLGDARPQVRRAAVLGLGALGGAAAVQALITALTDADPIVRERAVTALGEIASSAGERGAASAALLSLVRDEAPEVRAAALDALGALGDARTGASAAVALDDDVVEVRLAAMRALTRVPSVVATAALVNASADEDREGRAALAALARAPGAEALDAIVSALLRQSVARSAEDALEARMHESEAARLEGVAALARALDPSAGADHIARIAGSASRLSLRVSIAGLEDALAIALREVGGAAVLEALGRTGAELALVPILDALASEAASTRSAALAGLEGLAAVRAPDGRILDPLSIALPRLDGDEQARAATVVGLVPGERASDWLIARLDDASAPGRIAALRALRGRAPASASPRLVSLLEDPDAEVRSRAALALARAGGDDVVLSALADGLVSEAPRDRHAILLALGPMLRARADSPARTSARDAILRALDANDPELADSAAWAIAASGDDVLLAAVLVRASARGPRETARLIRAMSGASDHADEARTFCLSQLTAGDPAVQLAALTTLAQIGDESDAERIAASASSLRFPVSAAAAFALAHMARRGLRSAAMISGLTALAASHDPHVRANVALAAAHLELVALGDATPLAWLAPGIPPVVRAAAARWATAVRSHADATRIDASIAACAADLSQPGLARACASPVLHTEIDDVDLVAVDARGAAMPDRLVAVRLADGSALVTYTDARGRLRFAGAPAGPLSLDAPESAVLVP